VCVVIFVAKLHNTLESLGQGPGEGVAFVSKFRRRLAELTISEFKNIQIQQ